MSNKKQFEYIENKIKEAAGNNKPVFEESAWKKMEALLDTKEKKRRPFFWLWFLLPLLLAGGWGAYIMLQPPAASEKENEIISQANTEKAIKKILPVDSGASSFMPANKMITPVSKNPASQKNNPGKNITASTIKIKQPGYKMAENQYKAAFEEDNIIIALPEKKLTGTNVTVKVNTPAVGKEDDKPVLLIAKQIKNDTVKTVVIQQQINKENGNLVSNKKKGAIKKSSNTKGFYLLASAGADAASVKLFSFSNSTATVKYGLGIGYQFGNKWSVQTGLYVTNKKYIAGPGDYNAKEGSYWNMVQIKKVKAACLVYEIPVTVKYNFIQKPATTYYAAIGASSYILKKEDYNYYYTRDNIYHEASWQYTGNKHLFSLLTLAAGIEKKLSQKISLVAEPSLSIPLSGVGDGRVKLFSTTVQIGIKYQPFKKR